MTAPLPLTYGQGRSLVDKTRLRWAGVGNLILGGLLIVFGDWGDTLFGLLLVGLAVTTWILTGFGSVPFGELSGGKKTVVVIGSFGYLVVVAISALWTLAKKIVDAIQRASSRQGPA